MFPTLPRPGDVRVWQARTTDAWSDPSRIARALTWLTAADRARHARYRQDADRDMFLLGRVMARTLVGRALGVAPCDWEWREGERGRPEVALPGSTLSFNLAHSAGLVVCAIASDRLVGADVEFRERRPVDPGLVRRFCSPAEVADIERHGPDRWHDRFLQYWTLKEAYLKARGLGIAVPLAEVSFSVTRRGVDVTFLNSLAGTDPNWAFALVDVGATHFIAAAAPAPGGVAPGFNVEPFPSALLP